MDWARRNQIKFFKKVRPDLIDIADRVDPTMDIGVQSDSSSDSSSSSSSSGDDTNTSESEQEEEPAEIKVKPSPANGHKTIEQLKIKLAETNNYQKSKYETDHNGQISDYVNSMKK
jgi:hypothetical protein